MTRLVHVSAPSGSYEVKIGSGLLPAIGQEVRAVTKAPRCAVVSGTGSRPSASSATGSC